MGADPVEPRDSDYSAVPYRSTSDDTVSSEETAVLEPVTGEDVNLSESPNQPETDLPSSRETEEMTRSESTETENTWKLTLWRRSRPFGGGLCMILSGIVLMVPAYLTLKVGDMLVTVSSLGVSTLLLGVLLIVCGLLAWFRADGRILWGVAAMLMGIIALPTSNIGGFLLGTTLALIGGAWALSWTPFSRDKNASKKTEKRGQLPSLQRQRSVPLLSSPEYHWWATIPLLPRQIHPLHRRHLHRLLILTPPTRIYLSFPPGCRVANRLVRILRATRYLFLIY